MITMGYLEQHDLLVRWIGDLEVNATSDLHEDEILDTKIEIQGGTICWVPGEKRDEFIKKMQALVNEYRI